MVRVNCVDCLDRTNIFQFHLGVEVLALQLAATRLLPRAKLPFDSQMVTVLSELYDLMGDTLALQYAGSVAHKKYQLISRPRMMKHSKELFISIHRHYSNVVDGDKQHATNLFLGLYKPKEQPRWWNLESDTLLHFQPLEAYSSPGSWWQPALHRSG